MTKKRKRDKDPEELERKIRKYQERLERLRDATPTPPPPERTPSPASVETLKERSSKENSVPWNDTEELIPAQQQEIEDVLDEEILTLLGDAPPNKKFGPAIHKELASRWADTIKKGLLKEKRVELKDKYLPPENCKTLDAPKLNLEALAAISDIAVKRDKAMTGKQTQIGCALTALAMAFGKLVIMNKDDLQIQTINHISDAARLLCDLQYQESTTRRNFVLQGLDQSIRDSIKDAEVDQWLFGEAFADKLKASKAIKKSGQEISVAKIKKPQQQQPRKPLNFRGPAGYQPRSQPYQAGPRRYHHNQTYKKQGPRAQPAPLTQKYSQNKAPPRVNSRN